MLALSASIVAGAAKAADPEAGKRIFQTICHRRHAALPYTGRIGVENLPKFLANPKAYKPSRACAAGRTLRTSSPILPRSNRAYITANQ
jgi:hypothetical protein